MGADWKFQTWSDKRSKFLLHCLETAELLWLTSARQDHGPRGSLAFSGLQNRYLAPLHPALLT